MIFSEKMVKGGNWECKLSLGSVLNLYNGEADDYV